MTDSLTLQDAAKLAGVPPEQLKRWAWTKNGPRNIGSKLKPRYLADDIEEWKQGHFKTVQQAYDFAKTTGRNAFVCPA